MNNIFLYNIYYTPNIKLVKLTISKIFKIPSSFKSERANSFSDGSSIYILTENDQMIDLLKKGQAVFGISLGPVHTETEAEVFSLFPEKISVQNR